MKYRTVKLGDVITIQNGYGFKSTDFIDEGVPVLKIKNIKPNKILLDELSYISEELANEKSQAVIQKNDILITMTGNRIDGSPDSWVGKVALFNKKGKYMLNQRISAIRVNEELADTRYIAYILSSWDSQLYFIKRANSSGGQANISPDIVNNLEIKLPSLEDQKKIAKILEPFDSKIENMNEQLNTLSKMRINIFNQLIDDNVELDKINI